MLRVMAAAVAAILMCAGAQAQICNTLGGSADCAEPAEPLAQNSGRGGDDGLPGYDEFRDDPQGPDRNADTSVSVVIEGPVGLYEPSGTAMCAVEAGCD